MDFPYRSPLHHLAAWAFFASTFVSAGTAGAEPPVPGGSPPPEPVAPQPSIVAGEYRCFVGEHLGIDDADARTATDLVCGDLGAGRAPTGAYEVRFGKLGGKILIVLGERASGEQRRILVRGFEELPEATHRLVAALVTRSSVAATQNVDNVVASDSRVPQSKALATYGSVGLVAMTGVGMSPAISGGASISGAFRSKGISIGGDLRGGGLGSNEDKLGFASADALVRFHFSDADFAPFVGGGLGFSYLKANRNEAGNPGGASPAGSTTESPAGSGLSAHVETGLELLRSSRFGAFTSFRADVPFYMLDGKVHVKGAGASFYEPDVPSLERSKRMYVVPLALSMGFTFR